MSTRYYIYLHVLYMIFYMIKLIYMVREIRSKMIHNIITYQDVSYKVNKIILEILLMYIHMYNI